MTDSGQSNLIPTVTVTLTIEEAEAIRGIAANPTDAMRLSWVIESIRSAASAIKSELISR